MKKNIAVIRESITKVVALLTNRSIKVTQRGSKAYVQYHPRTGAIQLVNLPYLPDDSSDEFIAAVQGFLDHEVGHVLFTDPKIMPVIVKEPARVKNLANAIEDVFIERRMSAAFIGAVGNLDSIRRFHSERIAKPKIEEALKSGNIEEATGYASLMQFRAWGGQQVAQDFFRDNPKYVELVKPMVEKLGPELAARVKTANSSWDCLELARAMLKKLEEMPPSRSSKKSDSSEESSSGPDSDPDEPEESEDTPDKKSSGKTEPTKPPSEGDQGDSPDENTPDDEADEAGPEDEGTVSSEVDDSDKKRDEKSRAETDDAEEGGEGKDGSGTGEAGDSDSSEDMGDELTGEKTQDDGEDGGEDGAGQGDGGHEAEESDDGEDAKPKKADKPSDTDEADDETETGAESEPELDLGAALDVPSDFDKEISGVLTDLARSETLDAGYRVFSTDWDKVEPAPLAQNEGSIVKMVDSTQHMIGGIQKTLERAIAAKSRKGWNAGQTRGRISPGALFRTSVGDDRVFRKRYEVQGRNTAVSLLIDCSGSMFFANRVGTAGLAAFALSSTLERLKINHEVIGFTTRECPEMVTAMKKESLGVSYARSEALYMPVFKGFKERLGVEAKSRIAHLTEHPRWLNENVDGECLQIAAHRLKTQVAERHILMVLSDGNPACPGDSYMQFRHLRTVAKDLAEKQGVEVIGIGIQDKSVASYYDKYVVLNTLGDLPTTVVAELSKVLLAP